MAQWILKANGQVVPRQTCRPLQVDELHSETLKRKRSIFDELIEKRWGTSESPVVQAYEDNDFVPYEDEDEEPRVLQDTEEPVDSVGRAISQQPSYDKIINAEVSLQLNDQMALGKVIRRATGPHGKTVGRYHDDPRLNSMVYEVEFPDGQIKDYAANVIAENIITQVDLDGLSTTMLDAITDWQKDESAVEKAEKYLVT